MVSKALKSAIALSLALVAACHRTEARPDPALHSEAAPSASASATAPPTSAAPVEAGPPEVRAWFSLAPKPKCPPGLPEYGTCYVVTLTLHGAVEREIVVAKNQWGQDSCKATDGKSVMCGGASGSARIQLRCAPSGSCDVESVAESDGYCPPPEDCSTKAKLASFTIPSGAKLTFAR